MRPSFFLSLPVVFACQPVPEQKSQSGDTPATISIAMEWEARAIDAPARFRPFGWSDENNLWGLARGRVAKVEVATGKTQSLDATAWSIHTARGVVSWRNETGTWMMRVGETPVRLAGPGADSATGFDGPPTILWSPDGKRAILGWQGEWDAQYELLEPNGTRRRLETNISGYFGDAAVLWLDSSRVLFQTVAKGPAGKAPEYRESGWRGDLAVLELATDRYQRVTTVPDLTFLRIAGPYLGDVLVVEWDGGVVRAHWRYDARTWERQRVDLPMGPAFSSGGGAIVMLLDQQGDSGRATLVSGTKAMPLGVAGRDATPVFSPSGLRGAIATGSGVMLLEARR